MEEVTSTVFPLINQVLPTEVLKKILEILNIKSLCFAKQTCMRWRNIIHEFKLVERALSKFIESLF